MNTQDALMAMLPEHLLLGGIVLVIIMEVLGRGSRSALWVALGTVIAASGAAFMLSNAQYAAAPFAGQFSVTPAILMAKGALLALAVPVLLMSRTEFSDGEFSILLLSSLYGLCLLPSADSFLVMFLGLELLLAFEGQLRLGVGGLGRGAGRRPFFHREANPLPGRQGEQQQRASPDQPGPEASPAQFRLVAVVMFGQGRGGHLEHVRHHHQELLLQMLREAVDRDVRLDLVRAGGGERRAVVLFVRPAFLAVMGPQVDEVQRKLRFG